MSGELCHACAHHVRVAHRTMSRRTLVRTLAAALIAASITVVGGCRDSHYRDEAIAHMVGGNPDRGPMLIRRYG